MIDVLRRKVEIENGVLNIDIPPLTGKLYIFRKPFFPTSSVE